MRSNPDRLPELIERLHAAELIPPIKSVGTISGGIVRVIVVGALDPESRTRLAAVMGSARWKLIETNDPRAAGVGFQPGSE